MHLKVTNPYDQTIACEMPFHSAGEIDARVARAAAAGERWRRMPLAERARQVEEGLRRFLAAKEGIASDVSRQMGKPIVESRREVDTVGERARHMLSIAAECLAPEVLPPKPGFHRRIEHIPLGIAFTIAAWNYPLIIPTNVVVPALLAGNTVLLKHSALTPLSGLAFEKAFGSLEVPDLVASLVLTHEASMRLIADGRIAYVAFTGSVAGGRAVYRGAAERLLDAGLELGGKDPAYVAEDADVDFAAENVVDGACYNAGQSCCAVERVYVHRRRHAEFVAKAKAVLERYRLGDPFDEATTIGPLATSGALDTMDAQVSDAVARGARLVLGGSRPRESRGNFYAPTLLDGVPNHALAMQEESFGPLVPVLAVDGDDDALRLMADTRYGLTASVWTRDRQRAERFAAELEVGTVYQNRCDYLDPALPWTGARESGIGSTLSSYGFVHLTRRKSIHFRDG